MKKTITIFAVLCSFLLNAQFQLIVDDTTYGRLTPVIKGNDFLICTAKDQFQTITGLYKVNISNNQVTPITVDSSIYLQYLDGLASDHLFYGSSIYSRIQSVIVKIDLSNNTLVSTNIYHNNNSLIYQDKLYHYITSYRDLLTNTDYSYYQPPNIMTLLNPGESVIINNNCYFIKGYQPSNSTQYVMNEIYKVYSDNQTASIIQGSYLSTNTIMGLDTKNKPMYANGKLFYKYLTNLDELNLLSVDVNSNATNTMPVSNTIGSYFNSINYMITSDGIIFNDGANFYKTDGSTFTSVPNYLPNAMTGENLLGFFRAPDETNDFYGNDRGNSFVNIGNTTYFLAWGYDTSVSPTQYVHKLYKTNGINSTPQLIHTWYGLTYNNDVRNAIEINGQLYFYVQTENKIYRYNGTQLFNNDTNVNSVVSGPNFNSVTGLYKVGNDLVAKTDLGLMKLSISTLSTNELQKPAITIYPNPSKSHLNFSEELFDITVYDLTGRIVLTEKEPCTQINIETLPQGTYLLNGKTADNKIINQKIIKE